MVHDKCSAQYSDQQHQPIFSVLIIFTTEEVQWHNQKHSIVRDILPSSSLLQYIVYYHAVSSGHSTASDNRLVVEVTSEAADCGPKYRVGHLRNITCALM